LGWFIAATRHPHIVRYSSAPDLYTKANHDFT